jgi:predicted transposase YdaD
LSKEGKIINNNILSKFLIKHRAEVIDVCITEYDEQTFVNGIREEGRQEGRQEGRKEGRQEGRALTLFSLVNSGNLKPDIAAKELGISIHEFEIAMKEAGMNRPVSK